MMFLQYAVWGAWLPVLARFLSASSEEGGLGFSGPEIGMIIGLAGSIGAALSPFIAGQLADRYFSTERFLAVLLLLGGVVKWVTALQTTFEGWVWLSIAYSIVYMPTLALSNSMAFAHLDQSRRTRFPESPGLGHDRVDCRKLDLPHDLAPERASACSGCPRFSPDLRSPMSRPD